MVEMDLLTLSQKFMRLVITYKLVLQIEQPNLPIQYSGPLFRRQIEIEIINSFFVLRHYNVIFNVCISMLVIVHQYNIGT